MPLKIAELLKKLPKETKSDYADLLDRDANYVVPAKFLWDIEPILQRAYPNRHTFISALASYRSKKLGKVSR